MTTLGTHVARVAHICRGVVPVVVLNAFTVSNTCRRHIVSLGENAASDTGSLPITLRTWEGQVSVAVLRTWRRIYRTGRAPVPVIDGYRIYCRRVWAKISSRTDAGTAILALVVWFGRVGVKPGIADSRVHAVDSALRRD